ncbi:poly-beta-1,6-N-acetyl-D-glucosamine biosynthesis protein PgaD [Guyparkeria sp. 1SP6A2]|nr:poly-beta-1,6-N-acetyl-D-glucosamine biosynthesis protein PgaD [Guyparkeria sp. 1SP6A2]
MKHSRPRLPDIIERNDLVPPGERRVGQVVSLIAWAVWIYLITPIIALIGWLLGVEIFQRYILDDPMGTLQAVQIYVLVILIAGLIFIGWASYNWLRFHDHERRHAPPPISDRELAHRFCISLEEEKGISQRRIVTVHFNEDAEIIKVTPEDSASSDSHGATSPSSPNAEPSSR